MAVTREELEAVLQAQSDAGGTGDIENMRPLCSSRMIAGLENTAAMMQMDLAEFLKASTSDDAMLIEAMAEFPEVEIPVNGDTAGWFGSRVQEIPGDTGGEQIGYLLVRFVREEGKWKLDGVHMHEMPKHDRTGVAYADLEDTIDPEMRIDGAVHEADAQIAEVEVGGAVHMDATGFRIGLLINGLEEVEAQDGSEMKRVGSLRNGENHLMITAEPLGETPWAPEVKVAVFTADSDYPTEVFAWKGEAGKFASAEQTFKI